MHDLVPKFNMWGHRELALRCVILFYGGWRIANAKMTVGQIGFDTDIGTGVHTQRLKSDNALRQRKREQESKRPWGMQRSSTTSRLCTSSSGPDEVLIPQWRDYKVNELIKRVAAECSWGTGKWCINGLRHGCSREGMALVEDEPSVEEVQKRLVVKSTAKRVGHTYDKSQIHNQQSGKKTKSTAKRQ